MKTNNKIKYAIQTAVVGLFFVFLAVPVQASEITPDNIIKYVNLARESQGLPDLAVNEKLTQVAKDKLDDMTKNKYFSHTSPAGVNPWYWFQKEKYDYQFAGENLAINFRTAEGEQEAWMKSPTHRKNILEPSYQEIGVAVGTQEVDGQISIIAVQEFGATFAGLPKSGKTFAPFKNSDSKIHDGQIVPQVLSAKNIASDQSNLTELGNAGRSKIWNWFLKNKIEIINQAFLVAISLMILSMALSAAAFLALALDKMWVILENRKQQKKTGNPA